MTKNRSSLTSCVKATWRKWQLSAASQASPHHYFQNSPGMINTVVLRLCTWNSLWQGLTAEIFCVCSFSGISPSSCPLSLRDAAALGCTADGHPWLSSSYKGEDVTAPVPCTIFQHKDLSNSGCLLQLINVEDFSKMWSIQSANFVNFPFQWKWSVLRIFKLKPPIGTFTMYFEGIMGLMKSHYHWYLFSHSMI